MKLLVVGCRMSDVEPFARECFNSGLPFASKSFVTLLHGFPGSTMPDPDSALVAAVGMTLATLSMACGTEAQSPSCNLMIACGMPVVSEDVESVYPAELRSGRFDGAGAEALGLCKRIARSVYASHRFDYVFRVGGLPIRESLEQSGILRIGQEPVDVDKPAQVCSIVKAEACYGV